MSMGDFSFVGCGSGYEKVVCSEDLSYIFDRVNNLTYIDIPGSAEEEINQDGEERHIKANHRW